MQAFLVGYRERRGKVSQLWAGSGEGKAPGLSHWRGEEMGFIPAFVQGFGCVP